MTRFFDPQSRRQIAVFKTREMHAARWRNAKNLERWTEHLRSQWEIANLGKAEIRKPVDFEELGALW